MGCSHNNSACDVHSEGFGWIFGDIKPRSGEIFIEDSNKQKIRNIAQNVSYLPSNISNPLYLSVNELLRLARYKKGTKFQWNLSIKDKKIDTINTIIDALKRNGNAKFLESIDLSFKITEKKAKSGFTLS